MAKPHGGGSGGYGRPMLMGLFLLACIITHQHLSVRVNHRPQRSRSSKQQAEPAAKTVPEVAARPPFPTDPAHPVLYLIQLEGTTPPPSVGGADSLCVAWKQEMAPCDFAAGSSWTQGRNHLWKKATLLEKKYMYYVFMDEDIQLSNLTEFEELLLKYQPPIGVPAGIAQIAGKPPAYNMVILHSFDAAFDAFHYDVMHDSMVLPYSDLFDKFSWWASQLFMIYLCQIFYNNEVVGFLGVTSANAQHRLPPGVEHERPGHVLQAADHRRRPPAAGLAGLLVDDRGSSDAQAWHPTVPRPRGVPAAAGLRVHLLEAHRPDQGLCGRAAPVGEPGHRHYWGGFSEELRHQVARIVHDSLPPHMAPPSDSF
eukprot:TRINITY_DN3802_c0_g1_i1.p1 TRINITY_DN3802_c0_g1~~TRINITY_DN3802_c0_g1_i1.p1  ORF type:complete len:368 (+),score=54.16 TRINITY_DN3802_c0_g1_i1:59-1162(+)